nr:hypothetical protein [Tanacetum cinerariifolium]
MGLKGIARVVMGWFLGCDQALDCRGGEEDNEQFLALEWHLEETHVTWTHLKKEQTRLRTCTKIHQEVLFSGRGDDVAGIKRRRRDLSGDGVRILATASQRSRLKVDLEPSTWRWRQEHKATLSQNMIDMLSKNMSGSGNKRLKGRDWTDYDVKSSKEMLKKIDGVLRDKERLRRLEDPSFLPIKEGLRYAARYYKECIEDMISKRWSKEVCRYHFEALNGIHHWEEDRIDFFKEGMSTVTKGNVQDKLHHLPLEFMKDFNNALLNFIRRTVIKNRVEDIQLLVESYQRSLNLTKHIMFFEGIDQRIPFTMIATHKGNMSGSGNKRLKGRDWTDYDVKSSKEMLKKIDGVLRDKERLRRLEEYVGGRPKTINPCTFVRPL